MKSLLKLVKFNYKHNVIGYLIVGILLFIPITYCAIQTYSLYDAGYSIEEVDHFKEQWEGDEYFWCELNSIVEASPDTYPFYIGWGKDGSVILFSLLNLIVIIWITILSRRNRNLKKVKVLPFTILSLIVYGGILSLIEIWFDSITVIIDENYYAPIFISLYFRSSIISLLIMLIWVVLYILWKAIKILRKIKRKWVVAILILIYAILFPCLLGFLQVPILLIILLYW